MPHAGKILLRKTRLGLLPLAYVKLLSRIKITNPTFKSYLSVTYEKIPKQIIQSNKLILRDIFVIRQINTTLRL